MRGSMRCPMRCLVGARGRCAARRTAGTDYHHGEVLDRTESDEDVENIDIPIARRPSA
jgi:hypothetical protein